MEAYLFFDGESAKLKSYKSSTDGTKSVLRIEFEVLDHVTLGHLLKKCAEFQSEQNLQCQQKRSKSKQKPKPSTVRALPAPLLQLSYQGDSE